MYRRLWKSPIPVSLHIQSQVFELLARKFSLNFWRSHPQSTNLTAGGGSHLFLHMYGAKLLGDYIKICGVPRNHIHKSTGFAMEYNFNLAFTNFPHSPVYDPSSTAWCL